MPRFRPRMPLRRVYLISIYAVRNPQTNAATGAARLASLEPEVISGRGACRPPSLNWVETTPRLTL